MNNLIGQTLGRYHILEQLGEGGMAVVYKAYDTRLEREVAVKVIRTERLTIETMAQTLKRFEREAKSLAKLTHPNIVPITDYGEHEGKPYLVMPHLPGGTLKQMLGRPMRWEEAIRILLPVARALAFAHQQGIIHRDVKPSNILITSSGEPMLTDFGIAKILVDSDSTAELTGTGMGIGTPEYMAPEQWTGHVTPQTDIYALGVVLYEMVTGRKPYLADTPAALLLKQANDPLPRPRSFVSGLPDAVEKVLFKALAKSLEDRYQGMGEMVKAMEGLLAGKPVKEARPVRKVKEETLTAVDFEPDEKTQLDEKPIVREKSMRRGWVWGVVGIVGLASVIYLVMSSLSSKAIETLPETVTPTISVSPTPEVQIKTRQIDGAVMSYIPAGEFIMGNDSGSDDERPAHTVYLDAFWIDQYEVTNAKYKLCVQAGQCVVPPFKYSTTHANYYEHVIYDNYPVIHMTQNMAFHYCYWAGGRLPTEAEWEKAARGGQVNSNYPWGNNSPNCSLANFSGCVGDTVEVGQYPPNGYLLFDMAGNVSEWVNDKYDPLYYQKSPRENPPGPIEYQGWIKRGGSFYSQMDYLRTSARHSTSGATYDPEGGVRCAQSAESEANATPSSTEAACQNPIYTVQVGDTLVKIATDYNTSIEAIRIHNQLPNDILTVGMQLAIPLCENGITPTPTPLVDEITDEKGVTMRLVPAGEFTMGSDNGSDDEKPIRQVYLDTFYMDKYEVTNAFYKVCVDAGVCNPPSKLISSTRVSYYENPQYDNFPVIYVNWFQAKTYCEWRGASLPTESQWEKAARGIDGRIYPWGNEHIACQNNSEANTCGDDTIEVGSYESGKSPYGLYDMGGNVFEWVENWYDAYPGNMLSDPNYGTKYRIVRGGSWYSHLPGPITYFRFWEYPDIGRYHIGFRCARSAE